MGVSSTTNTVISIGDGATTAFPFGFYFFAKANLVVYVYDTILGGITAKTLGVDFTISGTPTAQGLYPNGGVVNFVVAPLATDYVVRTRLPVETQVFNIGQNGVIPSVPLVQQFDYLTLLVQSLQDQVNRCVKLPVGFAPTFNANLPSTSALPANYDATLTINATGDGLDLGLSSGGIAAAVAAVAASAAAASASASAAATSASAASTSATAAAGSATSAAASATAAAASAAAAAASATAAAASAAAAAAAVAAAGTPFKEVVAGVFGGGNTVFTLTHPPLSDAVLSFILGSVEQWPSDYTLATNTVTFVGVDVSASSALAKYRY